MSIFKRLVLLMLLAMAPLLGMEIYNELRLRQALTEDTTVAIRRLAERAVSQQARLMDGAKVMLGAMRIMDGTARRDLCGAIGELAGQLPSHETLYLIGPEGTVRCASDNRWAGRRFDGRTAEVAVGGETFPYEMSLAPEPATEPGIYDVLTLIETPIALPGGEAGRLGVALHQGWMAEFARGERPRQAPKLAILRSDGTVLYRSPNPEKLVGRIAPPEWRAALPRTMDIAVKHLPDLLGEPSIHALFPLATDVPGYFVDINISENQALADIDAAARRSALLWALAAMMTTAGIWFGGERFIRAPIAALVDVTRRWREGDRSARARLGTSTVELKCLGRAFDEMAEALEQHDQERQQATRQAQGLAGKLSSILESTTDAVIELNGEWRYVFLNTRAREALEIGEPLLGRTLWDAFPALTGTVDEHELRRAMETRRPVEYESHYQPWDRWFHVRAFPSAEGIAVFFRDVTAAKTLELAARRSQTLLSQVLELLPVGVWILDESGRVVRGNPAGQRIWGGAWQAVRRYAGVDGLDEPGRSVEARDWAAVRALTKGETILGEVVAIDSFDGSRKTILNSALPVKDESGRIAGVIVVSEDVSELREATEAAERANLAKSKFLAAASHDLRQPAQSLVFLIDVLANTSAGRHAGKIIDNMRRSAEAFRSILDGLLDISKLDVGGITPQVAEVPLETLLSQLRDEYTPRFAAKGLTLRMVESSAWVRTDPLLLARMLRNLLENANKYTERGKVLLGCLRRGDRMAVVVADTGIGIPPDKLKDIWEEFYQVANPGRDRRFGLGLGLAIVRRLAELLGHRVRVRSVAGKGSMFSIDLPAVAPPPMVKGEGGKAAAIPGDRAIVVIDDDPIVLDGLRAVLEINGYAVLAVPGLAEALRRAGDWGRVPDVVVADYRLGENETGIDAVRELRRFFRGPVPSVILTGDTSQDLVDAVKGGCCRVMNKPVQADELIAVIEELARLNAERSATA